MKSLVLLCFVMILVLSCKHNKESYVGQVFGHAGAGLTISTNPYAPNSAESIDLALSMQRISGVEVDAQLSLDGEIWLYHEDDLNQSTDGSGRIFELTSEQLEKVRFKSFGKEHLVQLSDFNWSKYGQIDVLLDFRIQHLSDTARYLTEVQHLSNTFPEVNWVMCNQSIEVLRCFRAAGYSVYVEIPDHVLVSEFVLTSNEVDGVLVKNQRIDKSQVDYLKQSGMKVVIFEARSPKYIRRALQKKPDIFVADDLHATLIETE